MNESNLKRLGIVKKSPLGLLYDQYDLVVRATPLSPNCKFYQVKNVGTEEPVKIVPICAFNVVN
jgi:hypothetical protein